MSDVRASPPHGAFLYFHPFISSFLPSFIPIQSTPIYAFELTTTSLWLRTSCVPTHRASSPLFLTDPTSLCPQLGLPNRPRLIIYMTSHHPHALLFIEQLIYNFCLNLMPAHLGHDQRNMTSIQFSQPRIDTTLRVCQGSRPGLSEHCMFA